MFGSCYCQHNCLPHNAHLSCTIYALLLLQELENILSDILNDDSGYKTQSSSLESAKGWRKYSHSVALPHIVITPLDNIPFTFPTLINDYPLTRSIYIKF